MALTPGSRLGPYEISQPIGAGGMGEVYRARDTRLDRDVALKILPESVAADPDRLMRFEREAKTLAALNHPNIAGIFGIEDSGSVRALVMELVEGEDLAARLLRGPVPLDEARAIARQIIDALEAAHEAAIVHRDLKPANIKITPSGQVKVLDFGLAKALSASDRSGGSGSASALANSPTFTSPAMTVAGMILGTAAYMSPEQARGQAVDARADIWAFGVVLYEMLTGQSPFMADTVSDVLAAVLTREPDLARLPGSTPPALRRLIARCLQRDPRRRLRHIGDARWDLEDDAATGIPTESPKSSAVLWAGWALALIGLAGVLWALSTRSQATPTRIDGHFAITLPETTALVASDIRTSVGPLTVSPDGRHVVYVTPSGSGTQLAVRPMVDLTPRVLPGTEGARLPFFSPDGQSVGFFAGGKIKKTTLAGSTPVTLADAPDGYGAHWGANGEIVFAPTYSSGLFAVPEAGGAVRRVTTLDGAAGDDVHAWPQVISEHGVALFTINSWSRETSDIAVVNLATGARRLVQDQASFARFVPSAPDASTGHLLFVRDGALMAAPFNPAGAEPAGTAVAVIDRVRNGQFDVSGTGVLVYAPAAASAPDFSLVWVDRKGNATSINDLPRGYEDLHLSPDGKRVVLTVEESGPDGPAHVWVADIDRRTVSRVTFDGYSRDPVWSPDGQSIVYGSKRGDKTFGLYVQRVDGRSPATLAWPSPAAIWPDPQSWTPDGKTIVFATKGAKTGDDIWTVSLDTGDARAWLESPANEWAGRLSPDGRWMAYASNVSGQDEVYVQPFPGPGEKRLVSSGGGTNPIWSRDGRELFYRRLEEFYVVSVETVPALVLGSPSLMFSGRYRFTGRDFDVSPDGTRFVMMRANEARTASTIQVLLNWWSLVEARFK